MSDGQVIKVSNKAEFGNQLKDAGFKLVVIDFYAEWCGPCKMIAPKVADIAKEGDVFVLKVNVDDLQEVAAECKIFAVPTFVFYKNGKEEERFSGASEAELRATIEKLK